METLEANIFNFELVDANLLPRSQFSATPAVPGMWVHVAGTFDGAIVRMYVNGALESTAEIRVGLTTTVVEPRIGIGSLTSLNEQPWAGRIDEIKFHNRALSQEEIQAMIAADEANG